ncbi:MAG: DUF3016 domain-containing protein [Rubrivivax sp.]|nr:DUF3016 domain-containing protein [Rubrivivax sp.]
MPKTLALVASGLLAVCALPLQAAGTVEVSYIEPEKFTDIGFGTVDRERVLSDMSEVLKALGAQLPDGQTLKLEITNINLAGELRPGAGRDLRIITGRTDWPEVSLRYTLRAGNNTLKSGEAKVYDLAYFERVNFINRVGTNLPFERHMLRKWFAATFLPESQP